MKQKNLSTASKVSIACRRDTGKPLSWKEGGELHLGWIAQELPSQWLMTILVVWSLLRKEITP